MKSLPYRLSGHFVYDPLFRNSVFLMLSTAVMGGLGFFFWLINARLFSPDAIGIATTLISVMSLISTISLFGFNTVYVRYLASSKDPDREFNSGLVITASVAAIISTGFVLLTPWISPHLTFLRNPLLGGSFVLFMIVSALNMITDSVFIAHRSAQYNLLVNSVMSIVKLLLPPFLLAFGSYGIFLAASLGAVSDLALSLLIIVRRFGYTIHPTIDTSVVRRTFRYFLSNYISGLFGILPPLVLPILILNRLGSESAAFYYIDLMIANLLYVIPFASAQSLFAEGSFNEEKLINHAKQAGKLNLLLLAPSAAFLFLAGKTILVIYGHTYADDGAALLQLFSLAAAPIAVNYIYAAIFKVTHQKLAIIVVSAIGTASILYLSNALMTYGLIGIGLSWLIGNTTSALFAVLIYHYGFLRRGSYRLIKLVF